MINVDREIPAFQHILEMFDCEADNKHFATESSITGLDCYTTFRGVNICKHLEKFVKSRKLWS